MGLNGRGKKKLESLEDSGSSDPYRFTLDTALTSPENLTDSQISLLKERRHWEYSEDSTTDRQGRYKRNLG